MIEPVSLTSEPFNSILERAKLVFHDRYFELFDRLPTRPGEGDVRFRSVHDKYLEEMSITAEVETARGRFRAGYALKTVEVGGDVFSVVMRAACEIVNQLGYSIFEREWTNISPDDLGYVGRVDREDRYTTVRDPVRRQPEPKPEIERSEDFGAW